MFGPFGMTLLRDLSEQLVTIVKKNQPSHTDVPYNMKGHTGSFICIYNWIEKTFKNHFQIERPKLSTPDPKMQSGEKKPNPD